MFDETADKLPLDEDMRKKIRENNLYAAVRMRGILLETEKQGYWQADEEKIDKIRDLTVNLEPYLELHHL